MQGLKLALLWGATVFFCRTVAGGSGRVGWGRIVRSVKIAWGLVSLVRRKLMRLVSPSREIKSGSTGAGLDLDDVKSCLPPVDNCHRLRNVFQACCTRPAEGLNASFGQPYPPRTSTHL